MALGRGLSSLIQPKNVNAPEKQELLAPAMQGEKTTQAIYLLPLEKIQPNPFQPRKSFGEDVMEDLVNSIKQNGILQPIVVSKIKDPKDGVEYQIIAGERRYRASKIAKLKEIPAIVRELGANAEGLELALLENIQREDLNAIELASAYQQLIDEFKMTQNDIADKIGKSRQVVGNTMRLLTLPEPVREDIRTGAISENHARAILALPTEELRLKLWKEVKEQKLSARNTEVAARKYKKVPNKSAMNVDAMTKDVMVKLEAHLGTKVVIEPGKHVSDGGKIIIKYFTNEDLYAIVKKITGQ